jgi:penicillin amidase
MRGDDSSYAWQDYIPDSLQPAMHNPERGFVSSANQAPYDVRTYPYYMPANFNLYRSWLINRNLSAMQNITVDDMQKLQTSVYNLVAEKALPVLMPYLNVSALSDEESKYLTLLQTWNLLNDADSKAATVFKLWTDSCIVKIYGDEIFQSNLPMPKIQPEAMLKDITKDSAKLFADNINTPGKETLTDDITNAFKSIIPVLDSASNKNILAWGKFKDTHISHLLKIPSFSHLHVDVGGGVNIINAISENHGPSWRMVVELTDDINAYGVYPGGQSGNPGSKYYDNFINTWTKGKYYKIHFYKESEIISKKNNLGKMVFSKS